MLFLNVTHSVIDDYLQSKNNIFFDNTIYCFLFVICVCGVLRQERIEFTCERICSVNLLHIYWYSSWTKSCWAWQPYDDKSDLCFFKGNRFFNIVDFQFNSAVTCQFMLFWFSWIKDWIKCFQLLNF